MMKGPLTTAQLSNLIGLIYDAAINPSRWPIAQEAIRIALDCANTSLSLLSLPAGKNFLNITTNIPPEYESVMADYGPEIIDSWGGLEVVQSYPIDRPALLSHINPGVMNFETTTNRYALEWGKPQGLIDNLALPLARDEYGLGSLAMGRHRDAGPVSELELEAAALLMPHLQRAVAINRLFDLEALARSTFEKTLDKAVVPILLATAEMRLIHANPAAHRLLAAAELLRLDKGTVKATSHGVTCALSVAIAQAARDESGIGRKGLGIPARGKDGSAAALHVLPLHPARLPMTQPAVAAIFVADAGAFPAASMEMISSLFGLTNAEARVFELISAGRTVTEASTVLTVEPSTIRTHLLRLFEKTGVRRQAELVKLAATLASPVIC